MSGQQGSRAPPGGNAFFTLDDEVVSKPGHPAKQAAGTVAVGAVGVVDRADSWCLSGSGSTGGLSMLATC